jgi:phospholipase/lecithinase/hemolysin
MKNLRKYLAVFTILLVAGSCELYKVPEIVKPKAGSNVDFTKLVSVGNSLTSGYMNGALYTAGQNSSFPSIIAKQMALAGGGVFNQPDINSVNGYYGTAPGPTILGRLYLKGTTSPKPTPKVPGDLPTAFTGDKTKLNNFGVPGITIGTAQLGALGNPASPFYNALYARFASNPGTSTVIGDAASALANGGTFFTFWLGNNDVLGYATNGADQNDPTRPLTSNSAFDGAYAAGMTAMLAKAGTKGAVGNIPDVTGIPYFLLVPYNPIPLDAATATALNAGLSGYNQAMGGISATLTATPAAFGLTATQAAPIIAEIATRLVSYSAGNNKILIIDETLIDMGPFFDGLLLAGAIVQAQRDALVPYQKIRQTTSKDLIPLPTSSILGTVVGSNPQLINGLTVPLGDKYILIPSEIVEVKASVDHFNATIASTVSTNSDRLVLIDANKILTDLKTTPALINGSTLTSSISPPYGAFSVDGVHPNARGYAYIANKFIEGINAKWGSTIPLCNPNDYPGNEFPIP